MYGIGRSLWFFKVKSGDRIEVVSTNRLKVAVSPQWAAPAHPLLWGYPRSPLVSPTPLQRHVQPLVGAKVRGLCPRFPHWFLLRIPTDSSCETAFPLISSSFSWPRGWGGVSCMGAATCTHRSGSTRFIDSNFFHGSTLYGATISTLKWFWFLFHISAMLLAFSNISCCRLQGGVQNFHCRLQRQL
jgi:hypothetical protein